jgi:hypothetical protein
MNYKKSISAVLTMAMALVAVAPAMAMTRNGEIKSVDPSAKPVLSGIQNIEGQQKLVANFCVTLNKFNGTLAQRLTQKSTTLQTKRTETQNKLVQNRQTREQKMRTMQETGQAKRMKNYDLLSEHAKTDETKTAITEFKDAAEVAINVRKEAVAKANANFQVAMDQTLSERKVLIDEMILEYKAMVEKAKQDAATACQGENPDINAIKVALQTDLKDAKTWYQDEKKELEQVKVDLEAVRATHKADIKKAMDDFRITMLTLKADLKAVFMAQKDALKPVATATSETE